MNIDHMDLDRIKKREEYHASFTKKERRFLADVLGSAIDEQPEQFELHGEFAELYQLCEEG